MIFVYHFLCAWLTVTKFPTTILSTLPQSWLAQSAIWVTISTSAFELSLGRWHNGQFLMLITLSRASPASSDEVEDCRAECPGWPLSESVTSCEGMLPPSDGCEVGGSGLSSFPSSVGWMCDGPEKSILSNCGEASILTPLGVVGAVSASFGEDPTCFLSLGGLQISDSKHRTACGIVMDPSNGSLSKRVKKELIVWDERVEPKESSIEVISSRDISPDSSASYCLRYWRQNS